MAQAIELFERAVIAAEKLANEVARLRVDVIKLHGRIQPFDGEPRRPYPDDVRRPKTLTELVAAIDASRRHIEAMELDVGRIRGVMDGINSDAISREEMKPFLRNQ